MVNLKFVSLTYLHEKKIFKYVNRSDQPFIKIKINSIKTVFDRLMSHNKS